MRALRVASPSPYRGQHRRPGKAGSSVFLDSPPGCAHFVSLLLPPTGGNTRGPAEPVPRCFWTRPQDARTSCRFSFPLPGATPEARQSRFLGVPGLAPRMRALRVASPSPYRGQHRRPGKAGSSVFLDSPRGFAHFVSLSLSLPAAPAGWRDSLGLWMGRACARGAASQRKWSNEPKRCDTGAPAASTMRRPASGSMRPMRVTRVALRDAASSTASRAEAGVVKTSS